MSAIRSFIAIDTLPEVKEEVAKLQEALRSTNAEVRWDSREKFHITLKFLGNVEEATLQSMASLLETELAAFSPFGLIYQGVGCFPNLHRPRVIWVGAHNEDSTLSRVFEKIEQIASSFGFPREERQFHPHITVGRVKGSKNIKALVSEIEVAKFPVQQSAINEIILMKSDLKPTGSVYTVLRRFPLKGG